MQSPCPFYAGLAGRVLTLASAFVIMIATAYGQTTTEPVYRMPPKAIADLADAKPTPSVSVSPDHGFLLTMERPSYPSIAELAQPELKLAGIRFRPQNFGPSRRSYYTNLILKKLPDGEEIAIAGLPDDARIGHITWSPDGKWLAFSIASPTRIDLWIADVEHASARQVADVQLNAVYGSPFSWLPDNRRLVCRIVPENREPAPIVPAVPKGPVIRETSGRKAAARTYQDLLKSPSDEVQFVYYLTSQIALVGLDGGVEKIAEPDLYRRAEASPDGEYLLLETIHRPFSYLVPVYRFPRRVEVVDLQGKLIKQIVDLPLAEEIPIGFGAVATGPRSIGWRADVPAALYWVEAQDGGDPRAKADIRDKVFVQAAPFQKPAIELIALGLRYSRINWGKRNLALVTESWWRDRHTRTWIVHPDRPEAAPKVLIDRSYEDRYSDPGRPVSYRDASGKHLLLTDKSGSKLYLIGEGYSPQGNMPFLDVLDLKSRQSKRLWQCQAPYYERVVAVLDARKQRILTRRESKTEQPNYFYRDLKKGTLQQVTVFPHPAPQLAGVQKELIRYSRDDGVELFATLYLPAGYKPDDGPLPMLMWAYPREFKSAKAASQVTSSPYRFVRISWASPLFWLVHGYAVLDGPTMPIVGEGDKEPNDTYVPQLVASAKAAVDEVVRRGVTRPDRIAIGGHSYGAFMAANLLAHSDLFRAGIARSGAYNRTLTPFGFQAEERTFWQAPEVYFAMSPFMHADKVNEPILLIHGQADNNSGTFPIQSERFHHALKGLGGNARLVMLPLESHGYRARESIMHMLAEMTDWLDRYVKNAPSGKAN